MAKYTLVERVKYRFDLAMGKGLRSVLALLVIATLIMVGAISLVVFTLDLHPASGPLSYPEIFWQGLLRTLDAGTMGADQGTGFRAAMLVVTLLGVVIVATLIGAISNWFTERAISLRKGRSKVLASDHTLILGWNSKIHTIIGELCTANDSVRKAHIVILANRDKVQMEDEIRSRTKHHKSSRIIVRSGDPMSLVDLELTNHRESKSVIILAPEEVEDSDSISIKTALALINNKKRKELKYHIVAEIKNKQNLEAAYLVGGDEVAWVVGEELISRLIVQTSRQSGLSAVFTELLDFEGSEIYLSKAANFIGKTYKEISLSMERGVLIGFADGPKLRINPSPESKFGESESLIVIAEDDSSIRLGELCVYELEKFSDVTEMKHLPEKTLILGSNGSLQGIVTEMTQYLVENSTITILAESTIYSESMDPKNSVQIKIGDPTNRRDLERLDVASFNHIVVLTDSEKYNAQHADARTLMTLLHLRELTKNSSNRINIVSEMLDDHNRELAETTDADDFIVSDKLVSLMMTQIEENRELVHIFRELFSSQGSEIMLHPAEWYVRLGEGVNFDTVIASALRTGESAIGFHKISRRSSDDRTHGVTLAPDRRSEIVFEPGDKIVVLSEN